MHRENDMNRVSMIVLAVAAGLTVGAAPANAAGWNTGLALGLKGGFSFRGSLGVTEFARGFPFGLDLSVTMSSVNPGDALRARRIFVNQNTNGTPEKTGSTWDLRMDFMYDLRMHNVKGFYLFAGPRVSFFTGDFKFIDGNEDFEVTSTQWGIGAGAKGVFSVSQAIDLTLTAGVDGYFPSALYGHSTIYSPDGSNVDPKENFTYKDAAAAIGTPRFQPVVLMGLAYNF
jgi:hypothetical protein